MNISAILWDYDGTIIDTSYKNWAINKKIYSQIKPEVDQCNWPSALTSAQQYHMLNQRMINWRDVYKNSFGFTEQETDEAGRLWSKFQETDNTPAKLFKGIPDVIQQLNSTPQGICSQNCRNNITTTLEKKQLVNYFSFIVGHNNLPNQKQKPDPEGFIYCLEQMGVNEVETVLYIGDHREDVTFAKNAQTRLRSTNPKANVISIAACYSDTNTATWQIQPDYKAFSTNEILSVVNTITNLM